MGDQWARRRCLVTGGSGFGGSHLCAELIARKARVFVYDRHLPRDSYLVLEGLDRKVDFVTGDIRDLGFLKLNLQRLQIDTVFHLAAQPIVPISNLLPYESFEINAMGTCAVLEAVRLSPTPLNLIVASSAAYYGRTVSEEPIPEDREPRQFTNLYSASKVATDVLTRCYAQTFGMRAATCRFMNTYGPGDTNFSRIIPRSIQLLLCGEDYDFGDRDDGNSRLDFIHIRDVARAYIALADCLGEASGQSFNIGSGQAVRISDMARRVSMLFDGRDRYPVFKGRTQQPPAIKFLDITKARRTVGWSPQVPLEEGLRETIDWYRTHWANLE